MHLGNAALTPECALATSAMAAAGLGFAAASLKQQAPQRDDLLMAGALGSAVFAAQMLNVPVLSYSSAHLVGGVLLAIVLRPALGALTMAAILVLQAVLLGDGGLLALGANVLNMALLPAAIVALGNAWQTSRNTLGTLTSSATVRSMAIGGAQAALAVVLAAAFIVVEVGIGQREIGTFAASMLGIHLLVGALEGLVTAGLLYAMRGEIRTRAAIACAATLLLFALLPLASSLPDGYEASTEVSRWSHVLASTAYDLELANAWMVALFVSATAVICCIAVYRTQPTPAHKRV